MCTPQQLRAEKRCDQSDRAGIGNQRKTSECSSKNLACRSPDTRLSLKKWQSFIDEVEAHVRRAVGLFLRESFSSKFDGFASHHLLGDVRASGDPLDDMPVAIAGGEIHLAIRAPRISAQDCLNGAYRFDEVPPVG